MNISTRFIAAASIAAMSLFAGSAMAQEKLTIGTEGAYPPFNNLEANGTLTGFDIDIAKALCDEMKVSCTFVTNDWDGIIPALQAKKFDAIIASMSITPERKEQVTFSKKYYNTPPAIAVPKDSTIKDATPASLKGKTLGAQGSTSHSNYVEKHFPDAQLKLYPTADEYKLDVSNGRIDGVVDDIVVLSEWVKSDAGSAARSLRRCRSIRRSTAKGRASRFARENRPSPTSSQPQSRQSAPTGTTRRSRTSTSISTSTATSNIESLVHIPAEGLPFRRFSF
jgi:polar amino acid transport system substrate-binding protein